MHSVATSMTSSPRQAPSGALPRPEASASATPPSAITTPALLRRLSRSAPTAAATSMVVIGIVESASAPRAAVVRL
jgi:hypothetical protein